MISLLLSTSFRVDALLAAAVVLLFAAGMKV